MIINWGQAAPLAKEGCIEKQRVTCMSHVVMTLLKDEGAMIGKRWDWAKHFAFATGTMIPPDARAKPRGLQNRFPSLDVSKGSGTSIEFQV